MKGICWKSIVYKSYKNKALVSYCFRENANENQLLTNLNYFSKNKKNKLIAQ